MDSGKLQVLPLSLQRFSPAKCFVACEFTFFPHLLQVKAFLADPSAFVAAMPVVAEAAAPAAAAAAAPAKEAAKEESEESDEDMGFGLFD